MPVGILHHHDPIALALEIVAHRSLASGDNRCEIGHDQAQSEPSRRRTRAQRVQLQDNVAEHGGEVLRATAMLLPSELEPELLVEPAARIQVRHPDNDERQPGCCVDGIGSHLANLDGVPPDAGTGLDEPSENRLGHRRSRCEDHRVKVVRPNSTLMVVDGALSLGDLDAITNAAEVLSFEDQDLGSGHLRRRQRADLESTNLATRLWLRIGPQLPPPADWFDDGPPEVGAPGGARSWVGLNPRMRFYRYGLGAEFAAHVDEPWRPSEGRVTLLTVLVYLPCGGCEGGETVVGTETVQAVDGRVAIFDHRISHSGRPVERGAKLVLRTDVVAAIEA